MDYLCCDWRRHRRTYWICPRWLNLCIPRHFHQSWQRGHIVLSLRRWSDRPVASGSHGSALRWVKHCRTKHPVFFCFLAFVCLLLMHSSHHAQSIYLFTFQWTLDRHQAKRFGYVSYCRRIYVIQTSDAIIGELKSSRIGIKSWHFCVLNIGGICVVFKVCIKSKLASWLIVFV